MPVKRPGLSTGVPSAQIVKASAQERSNMSQNADVDLELAALEAELQEEQMQATQPATQEEPAAETEPAAAEAALAEESKAAAPTSELAAEEEPAPAAPVPSGGSGATATKQPHLGLKRKPGLMVKKAEAKPAPAAPAAGAEPAAAAPTSGTKPAIKKPSAPAGLAKKTVKVGSGLEGCPSKPAAPAARTKLAAAPKVKAPAVPTVKPAAKPAAAIAAAAGGEGGTKIKKPSNAYLFFTNAKRAEVKAAHPDLAFGALNAKLGELYKALSPEEKAPFEVQAVADKQRYAAEVAAAGGAAAVAASKKPRVKRAKSAYQLFCDERLPLLRADNPQAGIGELSKLVSAEWKELSAEDKYPYETQAQALKLAAKAAAGGEAASGAAPAEKKKRGRAAGAGVGSRKKAKGAKAAASAAEEEAAAADAADEMEAAEPTAAAAEEEEEDDEAERMACDWEAHPAECILSQTATGKYVVLRRGLGLTEYGLVDAAAVKAQRLGGDESAAPCPVGLAQLDEYEAFLRAFRGEVHSRTDAGDLVLEDLPEGSLLDACFFLGKLREPAYELHKPRKDDGWMKVPITATSRVVHRMLMAERQRSSRREAEWAAERETLLAQLAAARGEGAATAKAAMEVAAEEE
ncbi:hypothetical protein ABPG75_005251 [Micractinium tetrahymenae]